MAGLSEARIRQLIDERRITMLGAGPMSRMVVDVIAELAARYRKPIALIPSRRQVDAENLGGGYVEGWSTREFADYVRSRDPMGLLVLSRDHSGPWQGPKTDGLTVGEAIEEAKSSLADDIRNGFSLLHLDPSPGLQRGLSQEEVEDLVVELMDFCVGVAGGDSEVAFEVGTDEQDPLPDALEVINENISRMKFKLHKAGLPNPMFYVVQTGTKVMELSNVGSFNQLLDTKNVLPPTVFVPEVLDICKRQGLLLKEHNADYLSNQAIAWHRRFGIHAANVAPEFGVSESTALLQILRDLKCEFEIDEFASLVSEAGMWRKWLKPGSSPKREDLIRIAGHYHFSDPWVIELRHKVQSIASAKGWNSEDRIKAAIERSVDRYLVAFGYGVSHA